MSHYPDNWGDMGAKARHAWSVAQGKASAAKGIKPAAANPQKPIGSSLIEQYSYYSEMIKSNAQGLRGIPDHKERNIVKAAYINNYRDYLAEYMSAGETHDSNVLFYCLMWACDCEQWDYALQLADYAVKTTQSTDIVRRDPQAVFANSVFEFANAGYRDQEANSLPNDYFEAVFERVISEPWAINPSLKARYYKLMGLLMQEQQPKTALTYYQHAENLKPDIGVKGRIKELKEQLETA